MGFEEVELMSKFMNGFDGMFGDYRTVDALGTMQRWLDDAGADAPGGSSGQLASKVRRLIVESMELQRTGRLDEARRVILEAFKVAHDGWLHF